MEYRIVVASLMDSKHNTAWYFKREAFRALENTAGRLNLATA
jgi:hypothetical protein